MESVGQEYLTMRWIACFKDERQVKRRLMTRGFEEKGDQQVDNWGADKDDTGLVLAATLVCNWMVGSLKDTSVFLQRK